MTVKLFKSKSILRVWCISYALMLITVICTNIYITNSTRSKLMSELDTANRYFMKNISVSIDSVFSGIDTIRNEISNIPEINSFAAVNYSDEEMRLAAARNVENLNSLMIKHYGVVDIMCYYPQKDTVITSSMFSESDIYYSMQPENEESYQEWLSALTPKTQS